MKIWKLWIGKASYVKDLQIKEMEYMKIRTVYPVNMFGSVKSPRR